MSAAAPLPPPGAPRGNTMNGYAHGAHARGAGGDRGSGGGDPVIAGIADAAGRKVQEYRHQPVGRLYETGRTHFNDAKARLDSRDPPAAAYWDFLVAYQIVVIAIPAHREYYDRIAQSRSGLYRDYNRLLKEIRTYEVQFERIKEIIINQNKRDGIYPRQSESSSRPSSTASQYSTTSVSSATSNGAVKHRRDDELMLPDVPPTLPSARAPPASVPEPSRRKPQVQPKPQSLHGRAVHHSSASLNGPTTSNDLTERFAKLRGPSSTIDTASAAGSARSNSIQMPSPSEYHAPSRPLGPRDQPPPPALGPTHQLPKLPLNTQLAASLPKEPSPTYSPARNMILPGSMSAPRSTARSMVGTGGRSNSMQTSSISSHAPNADGTADSYFPAQAPRHGAPPARRKSSVNKAVELQITADKLYDYLKMYNILLIDVRSREEFDSGHIYVGSVMCIEPSTLREGTSAEELLDRLVLSPDEEQAMYDRRHEYDVVVYYDESTKTSAFLTKHSRNDKELALKRLFDTLHEFNAEKPLQRPPIFLMGGIDAWTDLFGSHSLRMSTTAALVQSGQTRPTRAIKRVPAASHTAKANLQRRRIREYNPMDPEEAHAMREEARRGRSVLEQPIEFDEEDETESPLYRTQEDFLRRFPAVDLEQQSMMYPPSRPLQPPQYAPPPPPMHSAPSRPAPSVPRVSYSGVHERQVAPQGRTAQVPIYIPPGRYNSIRLHKTGLINFGVTCYMNSIIQCLCANVALSGIFLTGRWKDDVQKHNWKGTDGILPEAYATLISNLFKGDVGSVRPSTFRKICAHFNSQWGIDQQQDAKEFLEFVLDHLHEDLNVTWNRTPLKALTDKEELIRENLPRPYVARIEWDRYLHREQSMIGSLFAGQHASQLRCNTCGTTSTTYEAFWSISVEIPRDRACDLRDCLRSYCSTERLSGDEVWRCPKCKQDREAMKKITITRAPESLVVHFKRFSASRTERAQKVRTPINFPLQSLDLGPFMEPPMTKADEAQLESMPDASHHLTTLKMDPAMNGPYVYNAYAVVWHIGTSLGSGHYIAHVKDKSRGCWRRFNDEKITDFEPGNLPAADRLQNEKAYIVFYEREHKQRGAL